MKTVSMSRLDKKKKLSTRNIPWNPHTSSWHFDELVHMNSKPQKNTKNMKSQIVQKHEKSNCSLKNHKIGFIWIDIKKRTFVGYRKS